MDSIMSYCFRMYSIGSSSNNCWSLFEINIKGMTDS